MDVILQAAKRTLSLEISGLNNLADHLEHEISEPFLKAVGLVCDAKGRVIVTGMGKSGHIAQKIAATLASTGTPAHFVHPGEASHGDLGMITAQDVVLAFSWSGETAELANLIEYTSRFKVPLIAVTSRKESALGMAASAGLILPGAQEACPHGLAPTTSTTMQLAIGDALAIALLESRGFTASDFKVFHPGGKLGANLKLVGDIMHGDSQLPLVHSDVVMSDALVVMSEKSFGCLGVINDAGKLTGIITDGDLRRHMGPDLLESKVSEIMTEDPITISKDILASAAMEIINSKNITSLFVVDDQTPVGIVHVHDLLRIGVA